MLDLGMAGWLSHSTRVLLHITYFSVTESVCISADDPLWRVTFQLDARTWAGRGTSIDWRCGRLHCVTDFSVPLHDAGLDWDKTPRQLSLSNNCRLLYVPRGIEDGPGDLEQRLLGSWFQLPLIYVFLLF